ncbi:precorrin-2 C(20)-methyltransferase [soil metagenome]
MPISLVENRNPDLADRHHGTFVGIGVGPGAGKLIPLAAWEALQKADLILTPKAKSGETSVARQCLEGLDIPEEKFRQVTYNMDCVRAETLSNYRALAKEVAEELERGLTVAYLTIGDSLTYSTYGYMLSALRQLVPDLKFQTFPGVTSYAAAAAALSWPLGQGKECTLILPCPETPDKLKEAIENHDIVVLMKIGQRLPMVLSLLFELGIAKHCALVGRVGLPGEFIAHDLEQLKLDTAQGYLATMLIRKTEVKAV